MLGATGSDAQGQSGAEVPKRPLGRTGLQVSALGIGGYHLGSAKATMRLRKLLMRLWMPV